MFKLKRFKNIKIISLLVFFGLLFRILNPSFGYPTLYVVADEVPNYLSALNMVSQKTLFSYHSQYTPLGAYIQIPFMFLTFILMKVAGFVYDLSDFEFYLLTHEGALLFIPRIISGIFGSLSILIVYLISRNLFEKNKKIAYWSSAIFAFSLNQIQLSHLAKPWSTSLFFYLLSILFLVKSNRSVSKNNRYLMLAALAISISYGFLQIAFYAFMLLLLYRLIYSNYKSLNNFLNYHKITFLAVCIVGFSALIFNHLTKFNTSFHFLFNPGSNLQDGFIFFMEQIIYSEPILFLFAVPAFFNRKVWEKPLLGITLYIIIYYLIISILFYQASRYLLPILIIMPLYAALTILNISEKINKKYLPLFNLFLVILMLFLPVLWNIRFIKKPTFIQAKEWIDEKIAPSILIASRDIRYTSFAPSLEAIKLIQKNRPASYDKLKAFLLPDFYPDNVRNIVYLDIITEGNNQKINSFLNENKVDYIIGYYYDPQNNFEKTLDNERYSLVKRFSPYDDNKSNKKVSNLYSTMENPNAVTYLLSVKRPGPYVDVLKLNQ